MVVEQWVPPQYRGGPTAASYQLLDPEMWLSICRMVMGRSYTGSSGRYFRTSSSRQRRPACATSTRLMPVNCLETDATWKMERGVIASPWERSDMPYPRATTSLPRSTTLTAQPGRSVPVCGAKIVSRRAAGATDCAAIGRGSRRGRARSRRMAAEPAERRVGSRPHPGGVLVLIDGQAREELEYGAVGRAVPAAVPKASLTRSCNGSITPTYGLRLGTVSHGTHGPSSRKTAKLRLLDSVPRATLV